MTTPILVYTYGSTQPEARQIDKAKYDEGQALIDAMSSTDGTRNARRAVGPLRASVRGRVLDVELRPSYTVAGRVRRGQISCACQAVSRAVAARRGRRPAVRWLVRRVRFRSLTMARVVLGPVRARVLDGGLMVSLGRVLDRRRPGVGVGVRGDDWR